MKTTQLTGPLLDLFVALAAGNVKAAISDPYPNGSVSCIQYYGRGHSGKLDGRSYVPSRHHGDAGYIFDQAPTSFERPTSIQPLWRAITDWRGLCEAGVSYGTVSACGETMLLAGMRAFVVSVFGYELDIVGLPYLQQAVRLEHRRADGKSTFVLVPVFEDA